MASKSGNIALDFAHDWAHKQQEYEAYRVRRYLKVVNKIKQHQND